MSTIDQATADFLARAGSPSSASHANRAASTAATSSTSASRSAATRSSRSTRMPTSSRATPASTISGRSPAGSMPWSSRRHRRWPRRSRGSAVSWDHARLDAPIVRRRERLEGGPRVLSCERDRVDRRWLPAHVRAHLGRRPPLHAVDARPVREAAEGGVRGAATGRETRPSRGRGRVLRRARGATRSSRDPVSPSRR